MQIYVRLSGWGDCPLHVGMEASRVARWHSVAKLRSPAAEMAALTKHIKINLLPLE